MVRKESAQKIKRLAHTLNSPLTAALGYISMLKENPSNSKILPALEKDILKISKMVKEINKLLSE